jgi:hypothetical protein
VEDRRKVVDLDLPDLQFELSLLRAIVRWGCASVVVAVSHQSSMLVTILAASIPEVI